MDWILTAIFLKRGLRSDALWAHRLVYRSFLKHVPLFLDTFALMRSQYWTREKLERLRTEQLRELLRAAEKIPFWNERIRATGIKPEEDPDAALARMPVTAKRDLAERPLGDIADESRIASSNADHTSGSTGKPFHFSQDWGAEIRSCAVTERIFRTIAPSRPPIVYVRARPRYGFTFYRHLWLFARGFTSIKHRMEEFSALGQKYPRGFILYGYTSWVVEIARHMERLGLTLPIRAVVVAGEHLTDADRAYIERVMQAKLFTLYASREVGFLGYECELRSMHISEEWARVEVVDERGARVPDGVEGRIVVTTFDNRVMPFIRYELGDIGVISDVPCPCGRTLRTLTFRGRTAELIELEDNRTVTLLDIAYTIGSYKDTVQQYQIIQNGKMSFVFKVVPGPQFDANKDYLEALMVRMLHPRVQIRWELVDDIPTAASGKALYFVRDFPNGS